MKTHADSVYASSSAEFPKPGGEGFDENIPFRTEISRSLTLSSCGFLH